MYIAKIILTIVGYRLFATYFQVASQIGQYETMISIHEHANNSFSIVVVRFSGIGITIKRKINDGQSCKFLNRMNSQETGLYHFGEWHNKWSLRYETSKKEHIK